MELTNPPPFYNVYLPARQLHPDIQHPHVLPSQSLHAFSIARAQAAPAPPPFGFKIMMNPTSDSVAFVKEWYKVNEILTGVEDHDVCKRSGSCRHSWGFA